MSNNDNIFAQLQVLSTMSQETTVSQLRKQLNKIPAFFKTRPDYLENVKIFAEVVRNLEVQTLLDCDSFMVQDDMLITEIPEELQHDSLGFCTGSTINFLGRYVYPVKDVHGDVMGFCGYDMFSDVKYLDSINFGYKAKQYSLWGMERLPDYYRNDKPVFFVEGIVCALYLRQCGLQSLAMLGSNTSPYVSTIIRRFGSRAIIVSDSDEAGTKCRRSMKYKAPNARCLQSTVAKDVDDSRKVNPDFATELAKMSDPFYKSELFY